MKGRKEQMLENNQMSVVGFFEGLPIEEECSFIDAQNTIPVPDQHDILVK